MKRSDPATLGVVVFVTFVSLGLRLAVVGQAGFPLNDGGLFYSMITDLARNQFILPITTTYNGAAIAFAYPPLAFYVYAVLNTLTRVPLLQLMQYGPAVVSCASLPAFHGLALDILRSKSRAALAMLAFALMPRAFEWLIMGGGVTRSFGMLFALLAIRQAYRLFVARSSGALVPLIVLGACVAYSHPEAATHTAISGVLFYLWKDRSRKGFFQLLLTAAGVIALTSPWWGTVVSRHGWDPFLAIAAAARQDSYNPLVGLFALFRFEFADEPFLSIFSVLGLIGIFLQAARRQFLLPVWLVAMHALEPRGGGLFMMMPMAMCAGLALESVVLPPLRAPGDARAQDSGGGGQGSLEWIEQLLAGPSVRLFVGFVVVYGMAAAYATGLSIWREFTLSPPDLRALTWVRDNTAPQSRFALITGGLPLRDASSEWFPPLTGRRSVGTVFGYEWDRRAEFAVRVERYRALQACAELGPDCLQAWSSNYGEKIDFVYLAAGPGTASAALSAFLSTSPQYEAVYSSQTVIIYRKK
jgi:hypothetical protein